MTMRAPPPQQSADQQSLEHLAWLVEYEDGSLELYLLSDFRGHPPLGETVTPLYRKKRRDMIKKPAPEQAGKRTQLQKEAAAILAALKHVEEPSRRIGRLTKAWELQPIALGLLVKLTVMMRDCQKLMHPDDRQRSE